MHTIVNNHNRRLLNELNRNNGGPDEVFCNCRRKGVCPLGRWCNSKNVVYQACISPCEYNDDGERVYIGISAGNWNQGLYNHKCSFSNLRLRNQTALSKYFRNLKDQGLTLQIKWKIGRLQLRTASIADLCNLCIDEKISIIDFKDRRLLFNERNELVFKKSI